MTLTPADLKQGVPVYALANAGADSEALITGTIEEVSRRSVTVKWDHGETHVVPLAHAVRTLRLMI